MEDKMEILTVEQIKAQLLTNQALLERAVVAIYEKQTADEQRSMETKHDNGIGFAGCDSRNGSYMAQYILKGIGQYGKTYGQNLSGKFLEKARKFMPKYAKQLHKIQMAKLEAVKMETEGKAEARAEGYNAEDMDGEWEIYQQMTEDIEAGRL